MRSNLLHQTLGAVRVHCVPFVTVGLSVVLSIAVVCFFLLLQSESATETVYSFFVVPFINPFYLGTMMDRASLILLCSLGFVLSAKLGFFNLGGEGQAFAGAFVAVQFALAFDGIGHSFGIAAGCVAGFITAAGFGFTAYCLSCFLQINELISTYLLSCAVIPLIDYGIASVFRDPESNFIATPIVSENWQCGQMLPPSLLNTTLYAVVVITVLVFFLLKHTRFGYEVDIAGANPLFAKTQRIKTTLLAGLTMSAGAGLHGLAGAFSVYGSHGYVYQGITAGLGWSGIAAALIGRNHPVGIVFGSLFFSWVETGGTAAMIQSSFQFELSSIVQGIVFIFVTVDFLHYKKKKRCERANNCISCEVRSKKTGYFKGCTQEEGV